MFVKTTAVCFKDTDGNATVIYRGTDGYTAWSENAQAACMSDTPYQQLALNFFESIPGLQDFNDVQLSGHSKGGNMVQYVTIASAYSYLISHTVTYDGQGFSLDFFQKYASEILANSNKITSYSAEYDVVNALLYQLDIDRNYIESSIINANPFAHHFPDVIFDENGNLNEETSESEVRKQVNAIIQYVIEGLNDNYSDATVENDVKVIGELLAGSMVGGSADASGLDIAGTVSRLLSTGSLEPIIKSLDAIVVDWVVGSGNDALEDIITELLNDIVGDEVAEYLADGITDFTETAMRYALWSFFLLNIDADDFVNDFNRIQAICTGLMEDLLIEIGEKLVDFGIDIIQTVANGFANLFMAWFTNNVIKGTDDDDELNGDGDDNQIFGFDGDDVIYGNGGNDEIHAGNGNDTIFCDDGDDIIYGDDGEDDIYAGEGNDFIYGGNDKDFLFGEKGNDKLYGGDGNDELHGGADNDELYGEAGDDFLYGDTGADKLFGGDGNDELHGGDDDDELFGNDGDDTLYGDAGNDYIESGNGNNTLYGGDGDDTLVSGEDTDYMYGGTGNDYFIGGNGANYMYGEDGDDRLQGGEGYDYMEGGLGSDNLSGGNGDNEMYGQEGNDFIYGGNDNDYIDGGVGDDELYGGNGNNTIYGQEGDDIIYDGDDGSHIYGGTGNDTIRAGGGNDVIDAGDGDDYIQDDHGDDTIIFKAGYGTDTISDAAGNNTIELSGLSIEDAVMSRINGSDLKISFGADNIIIKQYFDGAGFQNFNINGTMINDLITTLHGSDADDWLSAWSDNGVTMNGEGGNDTLNGGNGDDALEGGTGNDTLNGNSGNDTYIFSKGSGNDTIEDWNGSSLVKLTDINIDEISISKMNDSTLVLTIDSTGDTLTVNGYKWNQGGYTFEFADGTTDSINKDTWKWESGFGSTAGEDTPPEQNIMNGTSGNDNIYGTDGNDIIDGSVGNDTLCGGNGEDTYIFAKGYEADTINEWGSDHSIIQLTDINSDEVTITDQWGSNLILTVNGTNDTLTISNFKWGQSSYTFEFADGAVATVNKDTWKLEFSQLPVVAQSEEEVIQSNADLLSDIYADDSLSSDLLTETDSTVISDVSNSVSVTDENEEIADQTDIQVMILTENMSAFATEDNISDSTNITDTTDTSVMNQLLVGSQVQ